MKKIIIVLLMLGIFLLIGLTVRYKQIHDEMSIGMSSSDFTQKIDQNDIYIPEDIDDCFAELERILTPRYISRIKKGTEEDIAGYHFSLGMWMRNNWGLWKGSHLAKWFNEKGIFHPDDMSGIILTSFWRHLNDKPVRLEEQIKFYQDFWKKAEERKMK